MNFTIRETKITRAVHFHAGTAWAEGVFVPHIVVMFIHWGAIEAIFSVTLFKKIHQRFRKPRHVMLITELRPAPSPQPNMSTMRALWAEAA